MVINRGRTPLKSTNRPPFHRCSREGEADPLARSGRPVSGLPRSRPITASQETCHACRARSPHLGTMPVASTEVVLAERLNSARPGAVRLAPSSPQRGSEGRVETRGSTPVGGPKGRMRGPHGTQLIALRLRSVHSPLSSLTPSTACRHLLPAGEKRYVATRYSFSFRRDQRNGRSSRLAPSSPQRGEGGPQGRMRGAARRALSHQQSAFT